jgi:hypothetical protein
MRSSEVGTGNSLLERNRRQAEVALIIVLLEVRKARVSICFNLNQPELSAEGILFLPLAGLARPALLSGFGWRRGPPLQDASMSAARRRLEASLKCRSCRKGPVRAAGAHDQADGAVARSCPINGVRMRRGDPPAFVLNVAISPMSSMDERSEKLQKAC